MVNKEVGEGVATKEELDLKTRVSKIIQKEQKRYNPTHTNPKITFQHQREKMERMMDQGYMLDNESNMKKPITELAKMHSAKLFALAKNDDIAATPLYQKNCPNMEAKYKDKWNVVDGVLVIGDQKKNMWVTQSGQLINLAERGPSGAEKARARWKAKLARMRRVRKSEEEQQILNQLKMEEEIDEFGDTVETKKLLEDPDIQRVLGTPRHKQHLRKIRRNKGKQQINYQELNKQTIKDIENKSKASIVTTTITPSLISKAVNVG